MMAEKVTNLAPPEPIKIPGKFAQELGVEAVKSLTIEKFVEDFFAKVLAETNRNDVGLRAVFYTTEKEAVVEVPGWSGNEKITVVTLENILERGGEYKGKSTLITRVGINDSNGNPETDMTKEYLRFATVASLAAGYDVRPAILVYNLENAELEKDGFRVTYPDAQTKIDALQMVYPLDISKLKNALGSDARMKA